MPQALRCLECHARISRTNQRALNKTLRALSLGDEQAALIAHAKTLASLVDGYPYETKLHSEYREVVKRLVEAGTAESPDAFAELLRQINEGAGDKPAAPAPTLGTDAA
jgi:maleate cis-trans isomerase